jgi:hypothetical protein
MAIIYNKKSCFKGAIDILTGEETAIPVEEIVNALQKEVDRLNRPRALSSAQIAKKAEQEAFTAQVLGILAKGGSMTIPQILVEIGNPEISNQRVNAVLVNEKHKGTIVRTEKNKRAYFELAK